MDSNNDNLGILVLRNSGITFSDISLFVSVGIISYISFRVKFSFWYLVPIFVFAYALYKSIFKLLDREPRIILDLTGIKLIKQNELFEWNKIKYAYIKRNGSKTFETNDSLIIVLQSKEIEIPLNHLSYNEKELNNFLELHLGKGKNNSRNKFRDDIQNILANKENVDEIMWLFSKHKSKLLWIGLPICFGVPGLSVYFQIKSDFPYVFAIGFVLTVLIMFVFMKSGNERLRQIPLVYNLSKNEFDRISIKYELRNENQEKRMWLGYIFLTILTVVIFLVSYLLSK